MSYRPLMAKPINKGMLRNAYKTLDELIFECKDEEMEVRFLIDRFVELFSLKNKKMIYSSR